MTPEMGIRFNIELALTNLVSELVSLLALDGNLEDSDKEVLRECSVKLNQLLLNKVL